MAQKSKSGTLLPLLSCVGIGFILFFSGKSLNTELIGSAPTKVFQKTTQGSPLPKNLLPLKEALKKKPEDLHLRLEYIAALQNHLRIPAHSSQEIKAEFAQLIETTAERASDSPETLRELAMRAFEVKYFTASRKLYKQYLELRPEDVSVRSQYASTLSFLGEHQQAIAELKAILAKNPEHFQTLAFLSIVKAGIGEIEDARLYGQKALEKAPHQEARERLLAFLEKLDNAEATEVSPKKDNKLEHYLKNHKILAQKFVALEEELAGKNITILVKDFPMHAMPEFAKISFLGNLKREATAVYPELELIHIVDQKTGSLLHEEKLKKD